MDGDYPCACLVWWWKRPFSADDEVVEFFAVEGCLIDHEGVYLKSFRLKSKTNPLLLGFSLFPNGTGISM